MSKFNPAGSFRVLTLTLLFSAALSGVATSAQSQVAEVAVQENLRAEPGGDVIGRFDPGFEVQLGDRRGNWVQVTVEGWVWARSLQIREGGAYDLRVSVEGGENIRSAPQGPVVGRLSTGALLEELERRPGWIHVRRTAWMWSASLDQSDVVTGAPSIPAATQASPQPASPAPASEGETTRATGEWLQSGGGSVAILGAPDGDTLASTHPGTGLQILSREGNWVRVRMDGWVWAPPRESGTEIVDRDETGELSPEVLAEDPDRYVGRILEWEVQFIAVERAEAVRTDFYEGEPFMLTRYRGSSGSFVYIAFPPDRLAEIGGLTPLERITVVGRVRTGRAEFTGSPILDLVELKPGREEDLQ